MAEHGRQVGVGDEVAANGDVGGHVTVDLEEPLPLREDAHAGQAQQGLDVPEGLGGRERAAEDPLVGGDAQVGQAMSSRSRARARSLSSADTAPSRQRRPRAEATSTSESRLVAGTPRPNRRRTDGVSGSLT